MIIPVSSLSDDTLIAIMDDYITREGTDYGEEELSLTQKREILKPQLLNGEVLVVFDEALEQVSLMKREDLPRPA